MTKDIIVSRQCMVGPNGYFDIEAVDGSVLVSVDFFRPEPDPEEGPASYPLHWCEYRIVYGGEVIHVWKMMGMDSVDALLSAMRDAMNSFEGPHFNKIDADKKYRDVIPYIGAIQPAWLHNMRFAGTWPDWTAQHDVIFQHADGRDVPGRIELGYPLPGAGPYNPSCRASIDGLEKSYRVKMEAESPLHALQLAMASLATRLRTFIAGGGRVLTPDGGSDVNLEALFGPLMRDATDAGR